MNHSDEPEIRVPNVLFIDTNTSRNGRDKSYELSELGGARFWGHTNATIPVRVKVRRFEDPLEKLARVIEAKHVVIIFNVIFIQKTVHFLQL